MLLPRWMRYRALPLRHHFDADDIIMSSLMLSRLLISRHFMPSLFDAMASCHIDMPRALARHVDTPRDWFADIISL